MMKSVRSRLTVTFIGLIAVILAVIWGVNKWYLEDFYVTKKVQALNAMYTAIDAQIAENKDNGITIEEAMERDRDANGNITEGNLQRLIRNFSDSANVSVLIIDNSTEDSDGLLDVPGYEVLKRPRGPVYLRLGKGKVYDPGRKRTVQDPEDVRPAARGVCTWKAGAFSRTTARPSS